MAQNVKTVVGVAIASVKSVNALAIASVKTIVGVDNTSGGTPAWSDSIPYGSANTNDDLSEYAHRQPVVAGQAGTITKVRIPIAFTNGGGAIKVAIYDSSRNRLGSVTTSIPGATPDGAFYEVTGFSVAASNGATYGVAWMRNAGVNIQWKFLDSQPADSSFYDFSIAYSAFPADPFASGGGTVRLFPVGIYIEP